MMRMTLALISLLGLVACAGPGRLHGSAAQDAACAKRADEVYLQQNRAELYRADSYATSGRDSPYAGGGFVNAPSLSDRYAREKLLDNCLAGISGASAAPSDEAPYVAPSVPKTAPPPPKP